MIFKKKRQELEQVDLHAKVYRIPYSKSFRGFKKYHMNVHGVFDAEENAAKYFNALDMSQAVFEFVCQNTDYGSRDAFLYINKKVAGAVYEEDRVKEIETGRIEQIHIEKDEETIVTNSGSFKRPRLRFFVKYKE
jgi:hypothetical protein